MIKVVKEDRLDEVFGMTELGDEAPEEQRIKGTSAERVSGRKKKCIAGKRRRERLTDQRRQRINER